MKKWLLALVTVAAVSCFFNVYLKCRVKTDNWEPVVEMPKGTIIPNDTTNYQSVLVDKRH